MTFYGTVDGNKASKLIYYYEQWELSLQQLREKDKGYEQYRQL